ncbi:MAG: PKD domain-containing protein [Blastocatellia bacterium]
MHTPWGTPAFRKPIFSILFLLLLPLFFHAKPSSAQGDNDQRPWGARRQAALNRLGGRLAEVARRYRQTPEGLRALLQRDRHLWLDNQDRLVFLDEFVPEQAPAQTGSIGATAQALVPNDQTFLLHSLPGGSKVIYLDFDGHTTTGTPWNNDYGATITSGPFDLDGNPGAWSAAEHERIQYIWQRVAEDFLPFGVDVTTQDPGVEGLRKTATNDEFYGIRVVISPTNWFNTGAGGVAYIGSFNWNTDTPCYAFSAQLGNGNEKYVAEAASHEIGHTVGLLHDGATGTAYYLGHGDWAPIMGAGYYEEITQWSKGEYATANQLQDDLTVMMGYGFTYRADDHGGAASNATALTVTNSTSVSGKGIIERTADKDYFSFVTGAGTITLNLSPGPRSPNLDIKADLIDSTGAIVASSNPAGLLSGITAAVNTGTYYLAVDGAGTGDPNTGYSDYASLGEFSISGTIVSAGAMQAPNAIASGSPTSGNAPLAVSFNGAGSADPDGSIVSYAWNFGDGGTAGAANPVHTYTTKGSFTAVLTVVDNDGLTDTASVTVTVTGPPVAPSNLSATAISGTQINLAWADNAGDETGFKIQRSTNNVNFTQIAAAGANVTSFSNTGLAAGTTYYYRVSAYNGSGDSVFSNTAGAATPQPLTLHVGDLDRASAVANSNRWNATVTITVHNAGHSPISGVTVNGSWSTGATRTCTTNANGRCNVALNNIRNATTSVEFTVSSLGYSYTAGGNHDPDGESNGTTITVSKP